ncbi:MAG: hypothetical protein EA360_05190, partial [Balneolaceae bacterium]
SLRYDPGSWGGNGVALERLSILLPASMQENWMESPHPLGGTPGQPNRAVPDTDPPVLISAEQYEEEGFRLLFDKPLDPVTVLNKQNYRIEPELPLRKVEAGRDQVLLFYDDLRNDQHYKLRVSGIRDLFGNVMQQHQKEIHFLTFGEPERMQLVINEILFRRANQDGPQFAEIFNPTEMNVRLEGWALENRSGSAALPGSIVIRAGDYLVLADREDPELQGEEWVVLPSFRSFRTTSDYVVLRNRNGMAIDSLAYSPDWHNGEAGVSLERMDPSAISIDPSNWAPSSDPHGSTPGRENSRYQPDTEPPAILFANFIAPDTIQVVFDKFIAMDPVFPDNRSEKKKPGTGSGETDKGPRFLINNREAEILTFDPKHGNRILLDASAVNRGEEISLVAENLGDFKGNVNPKINQPVAQPLQPGDLVINEILFHPIADPRDDLPDQSEYIEIYNRQPYAVSLEGVYLHDEPDERGRVQRIDPVSTVHHWLPGNSYLLIYPEQGNVPFEMSRTATFFNLQDESGRYALRVNRSALGLTNSGRMVVLADSANRVIDSVSYSPDWHNPNLIDTRGIALERISPDAGSNDPANWSSSADPKGGTPASRNSLFQIPQRAGSDYGITLSPNPFSPFDPGFDDRLFIQYRLDEPDYLLSIRIYDRHGRLVRTLAEGERAGFEGILMWDGRTDSGGQNRMGIYIILFEAYNSSAGRRRMFKETAVIARQF